MQMHLSQPIPTKWYCLSITDSDNPLLFNISPACVTLHTLGNNEGGIVLNGTLVVLKGLVKVVLQEMGDMSEFTYSLCFQRLSVALRTM